MKKRILFLIYFLILEILAASPLLAKILYKPVFKDYFWKKLKCTYQETYQGIQDVMNYPPTMKIAFSCHSGRKNVFSHNLGAQEIFSSNDNNFIIGLSNLIRHNYAFWIMDHKGNILARTRFDKSKDLHFCDMTINSNVWYNQGITPKFIIKNNQLNDVIVQGCDKKNIPLSKISKLKPVSYKKINNSKNSLK
ncbi:MAG: hypothetical protein OXB84_06195 [Halobacteriovoraceae bacterium]|nr:hypothetical protein [Halobacteriovoraceae bacterium]